MKKADYDLLTELLVCHVEKGDSRKNYVGINKAVEIVGQIDNDALCGLTVAHVLERFAPITGDVTHGLEVLEEVYRKLVYQELPKGEDWLDHLDTLGAIRMSSMGGFKKFIDYYPKVLNGYACIGIKKESEEYHKASELLQEISLNAETCLKPNEFLDGFVRIDVRSFDQIETLWVIHQGIGKPITSKEKQVFEAVWKLYETDAANTPKMSLFRTVQATCCKMFWAGRSCWLTTPKSWGRTGRWAAPAMGEVLLTRYFRQALLRLNPWLTPNQLDEVQKKFTAHVSTASLMQINEEKYFLLRDGIPVTVKRPDGRTEIAKRGGDRLQKPGKQSFPRRKKK